MGVRATLFSALCDSDSPIPSVCTTSLLQIHLGYLSTLLIYQYVPTLCSPLSIQVS